MRSISTNTILESRFPNPEKTIVVTNNDSRQSISILRRYFARYNAVLNNRAFISPLRRSVSAVLNPCTQP